MSHLVIANVSAFLRRTLWLGLAADADIGDLVKAENNIVLSNPAQPVTATANVERRVSLWLYQVLPNDHLRNPPFVRRQDDDRQHYPPLFINLYYLLTPSTGSDLGDQMVLGKALQIFHDQSIVRMEIQDANQPPVPGAELHLSWVQRTIEELAEVWEAMQQPYRLSVCYEVRVARIDSERELVSGRVKDRSATLERIPAEV